MANTGSRHRLVLYTHILDRWWRLILLVGIMLLILGLGLGFLPAIWSGVQGVDVPENSKMLVGIAALLAVLLSFFLILIRKLAYVQPFGNHLLLVTPFLRLKIAYRRIHRSSTVELTRLYSPERIRHKRSILQPLVNSTVIILDLNGLPLSRLALRFFLSPLFFPDKTPRLALLVPDWIKFSTELESFRSAWMDTQKPLEKDPRATLLTSLTRDGP